MIEWKEQNSEHRSDSKIKRYEGIYKGQEVQKRVKFYQGYDIFYSDITYFWDQNEYKSEKVMEEAIDAYLLKNVVWKTALDKDIDDYIIKSEDQEEYTTKADEGKIRLDLVPTSIIWAIGKVMTYGISKYYEGSWKTVDPKRYKAALLRHLMLYLEEPNSKDVESRLYHLSHVACNVAFLMELENIKEDK